MGGTASNAAALVFVFMVTIGCPTTTSAGAFDPRNARGVAHLVAQRRLQQQPLGPTMDSTCDTFLLPYQEALEEVSRVKMNCTCTKTNNNFSTVTCIPSGRVCCDTNCGDNFYQNATFQTDRVLSETSCFRYSDATSNPLLANVERCNYFYFLCDGLPCETCNVTLDGESCNMCSLCLESTITRENTPPVLVDCRNLGAVGREFSSTVDQCSDFATINDILEQPPGNCFIEEFGAPVPTTRPTRSPSTAPQVAAGDMSVEESDNDNLPLIVSIAVAASVVLVALAIAVYFVGKRHMKPPNTDSTNNDVSNDDGRGVVHNPAISNHDDCQPRVRQVASLPPSIAVVAEPVPAAQSHLLPEFKDQVHYRGPDRASSRPRQKTDAALRNSQSSALAPQEPLVLVGAVEEEEVGLYSTGGRALPTERQRPSLGRRRPDP